MRVKVLNISNNNNMGDIILGECAIYLIKDILQQMGISDVEVERAEVIPDKKNLLPRHLGELILGRFIQELSLRFYKNDKNKQYELFNIGANIKSKGYYKNEFKNSDAIIIAEGALKYSLQDFSYYFDVITEYAQKNNIPVMMNAMSIEKANMNDFRYWQLKKAVSRDVVKLITTRDGVEGVNRLKEDYQISESKCEFVGDSAFWIPECYSIQRNKNSHIYGIGMMSPDVFIQNGFDLHEDKVKQFYVELIKYLIAEKIEFRIFTNGLNGDYDFAVEVVSELQLDNNLLLDKPNSTVEFIKMISEFRAVIGARMHACITAFSLEVPFVGICWHDKLIKFASTMNLTDYFFKAENLDVKEITSKMLGASYNEKNKMLRDFYKNKTKESIRSFLERIAITQ